MQKLSDTLLTLDELLHNYTEPLHYVTLLPLMLMLPCFKPYTDYTHDVFALSHGLNVSVQVHGTFTHKPSTATTTCLVPLQVVMSAPVLLLVPQSPSPILLLITHSSQSQQEECFHLLHYIYSQRSGSVDALVY